MAIQSFVPSFNHTESQEAFNPKARKIEEKPSDIARESLEILVREMKNPKEILSEAQKEVSVPPRLQRNKNGSPSNTSTEVWECVENKKGNKGSFLIFKQREECNQLEKEETKRRSNYAFLNEKLRGVFPAIEPEQHGLKKLLPYKIITNLEAPRDSTDVVNELGFEWYTLEENTNETLYLKLPDLEELENGWEKERVLCPELPPLRIFPSERTFDDEAFIKAYLFYDLPVSTGKEFIHDSIFHLIPSLRLILSSGAQYAERRERMVQWIRQPYLRMKRIQKLMESVKANLEEKHKKALKKLIQQAIFCIAFKVDSLFVHADYSYMESNILNSPMFPIFDSIETQKMPLSLKNFIEKKFKESGIKYEEMPLLWQKMREVEKALEEASLK